MEKYYSDDILKKLLFDLIRYSEWNITYSR